MYILNHQEEPMSSMTIHSIDVSIDQRLNEEASHRGMSKNQLVKDLLAGALGLKVNGAYQNDWNEFTGCWSAAERAEFDAHLSADRAIDAGDWT
jgi:hypothetical protein